MPRAVILGGTGLIGGATARHLLADGWQVDVVGRDPGRLDRDLAAAGARFVRADRGEPDEVARAVGSGADLLLDCICYTAADAAILVPLLADCTSTVMISSKAVYVDDEGRHSNSPERPRFDGPVRETQRTLPPGDGDFNSAQGYGPNKVAAEQLLLATGAPVTVIRPSKVHGRGTPRPREWVFVKRALDRRSAVLLARRGSGVDHPTAAANLAALTAVVAAAPGRRILNCADPDAPDGLQISRTLARLVGHRWREVLLDDPAADGLGRHPWDAPHPVVLDLTAAAALGYRPVGDYAATVADSVRWLVSAGPDGPPGLDTEFFAPFFDYAREDDYLRSNFTGDRGLPAVLPAVLVRNAAPR